MLASNGLDPDQDRRFVGPDLGPNCLQRLSADDKSRIYQGKERVSGRYLDYCCIQAISCLLF